MAMNEQIELFEELTNLARRFLINRESQQFVGKSSKNVMINIEPASIICL